MLAWRVCKTRHRPFDGTGAMLVGARWNSAGRPMIYAADSFAGAILEILAHSFRPRTVAGPHHAVRLDVPDRLVEVLDPAMLPDWELPSSPAALAFGDLWLEEERSVALVVPAVTSRPVGRNVLVNPMHPEVQRIGVSDPFDVPWDERLF